MGATASLTGPVNVNHLSSQEVGALAASIGPVYQPYAQMFIDEGITGVFLATKDEVGFKKVLEEIGITRELHRDNIYTLFMSLKDSTNKAAAAAALDPSPPAALGGPEGPRMPPVAHTSLFPYGDGLDLGLEGALAALRMPTLGPADAEAALRVRGSSTTRFPPPPPPLPPHFMFKRVTPSWAGRGGLVPRQRRQQRRRGRHRRLRRGR